MLTRFNTPGKVEGWSFNEVTGCNWIKAWAEKHPTEASPFLILLLDGFLWVVPESQPEGTWGSYDSDTPKPPPDTSTFIGPFDDFDVAFATFQLFSAAAAHPTSVTE